MASPIIGERRVMTCKATGMPVEMEYVGFNEGGKDRGGSDRANGHPGWLCLHDN